MDWGSEAAAGRLPTVVSLCCGAGGMDLGFVAAGFRIIFAADFNPAAVATYRRNLGDHVERADLTTLDAGRIPDADVWVAGPPCQPFSQAGKRVGAHDPRDMWPVVLRLLEARRPPFAVFENVCGLLNWNGGAYLRSIEDRLRAAGYAVTRAVLDAADFGVPQHRKRVFLLCRLGGPPVEPPWPTHVDPKRRTAHSIFDTAPRLPWVTVRQALGLGGALSDQWAEGKASAPWYGTDLPSRVQTTKPQRVSASSLLDRPAPVVTAVEGKGTSPTDRIRHRKAGSLLAGLPAADEVRIIAQRNATEAGHGVGASVDQPSVSVGAGNPPRWAAAALAVASKRQRSAAHLDSPSVTVAADGRDALVALPLPGIPVAAGRERGNGGQPREGTRQRRPSPLAVDAPAPPLASSSGRGGGHIDGGAGGRRAWERLGIDPRALLDEPSATLRAGTHGQGGWSPRHRAGYVVDADGPAPTLFMGGNATEGTPGGGGVHQWSVAADDPLAGEAPAQTIDSSGEWHRPGGHGAVEPSRGPRSATYLRRLTVRECARLQAFPDRFSFAGSKTAQYAQVGNAVPPLLAWHVANAVRAATGLPAVPVPEVLEWYAAARPQWAAGEPATEDAEPGR